MERGVKENNARVYVLDSGFGLDIIGYSAFFGLGKYQPPPLPFLKIRGEVKSDTWVLNKGARVYALSDGKLL